MRLPRGWSNQIGTSAATNATVLLLRVQIVKSLSVADVACPLTASMARKPFTIDQIISKLREAEVELSKGLTVGRVCKKLVVTEQTYYRWRKEYGGIRNDQAKRLKELEKENVRLKRLLADAELPAGPKGPPILIAVCTRNHVWSGNGRIVRPDGAIGVLRQNWRLLFDQRCTANQNRV